jgi:hypothetical protein
MATVEYTWREGKALFKKAKVVIDFAAQTLTFENCMCKKKGFQMLPFATLTCQFDELVDVKTSSSREFNIREAFPETATAKALLSDVRLRDRFDELVQTFQSIVEQNRSAKT